MTGLVRADVLAAVKLERQANAVEVAEAFIVAFGNPDTAERILDVILRSRAEHDPDFWREVQTAFAQIRG